MKKTCLHITFTTVLVAALLPTTAQVLPKVELPNFKKDTFNITRYGAIADGVTLNTTPINKAIDACNKKGGGVVVVPAGLWNTGPVVLKSNVNLHLQKGAVLQFSNDFNQYPLVEGNWEGLPQMRNQSPISAQGQQNIAITGSGIIDGNGDAWRMVKKEKLTESQWKKLLASGGISTDGRTWYPSQKALKGSQHKNPGVIEAGKTPAFYDSIKDFLRPNLLVLTKCKKILLEGVIIQNSPAWCLHPFMSEHLTVRNVTVKNPWYAQNGDGIDVESCRNVLIESSTFDVGDDALCMKSGRDEAGRQRGMPTENVIIRNCIVYHAHGGFVVGSEMSGGARNIHVTNCTFIGTDIGLRFKTTRGRGGVVENIFIKDIFMKDIPGEAILFDMYYMAKDPIPLNGEKREAPKVEMLPVTEATPVFKDIYINNVVCNGAEKGIFIRGLPEMHIKNIKLENMVLQANKGIDCSEASGITFNNIKLVTKETNPVVDVLNSDNLTFNNITYRDGSELLFRIGGDRTGKIAITNTDASKAKQRIQYEFGATEKSVTTSAKLTSTPAARWSQEMAATAMKLWSDSFALTPDRPARWSYDQGVILKGVEGIWNATANVRYFDYIQRSMDFFVQKDGSIKGYRPDEYNIDHINNGKLILFLYRVTGQEKYKKAADLLRNQLRNHPRTSEGGFWHKQIYPYQMWLDGLYMGQPFYAEYAKIFHEDTAFNDITRQFVLMERHARDPKTGLLYHGWDETRQQKWANKTTGLSPHFWGRALGWYGMAMVDVLDHFPANHPGRDSIIAILNRFAKAVVKVQDPKSGVWYDIVDMPNEKGNYLEASASAMLVYTLAKGMRNGYLPASYLPAVQKGYAGIIKTFIETDANGQTNLKGTVKVSGLGGNPYRDGSFAYYMSEPVIVNDPKGVGAFIKCAGEVEMLPTLPLGKGKTVLLDTWFNNEWKKDATGTQVRHHYTWDDKTYGGFAMLGDIFRIHGMKTASLETAPTAQNLKGASIYVIVDPDTKKETSEPNYIQPQDVKAISDWVKAGGVLLLMGNDSGNAEFEHWNKLGETFGIHFNENSLNRVQGSQYEQGAFYPTAQDAIFKTSKKIYIKEYSSLELKAPATAVFKDASGKNIVMAVSKYGKGTVFAVGDPWFYNEYVDGRKLPAEFENYKAATDLVKFLIGKTNNK